jgi:hypothetical protein
MSRRRTTYADIARFAARRRVARKQQALDIAAMLRLETDGHAPLCAVHMRTTGKCRCDEAIELGWRPNAGNKP